MACCWVCSSFVSLYVAGGDNGLLYSFVNGVALELFIYDGFDCTGTFWQ